VKVYRARYTSEAALRIRKFHPQIKQEIKEGVRVLLQNPFSGHELQFELVGYRAYRVRNHRIIYAVNDEAGALEIIFVGPRRSVYEELRTLLFEQRHRN